MVTITAPGTQINEVDLSFYDFPQPKEETQNVLVTGFSPKGHTNYLYEFTNKNTDDDLIATFGTPTNEAERYFFNTCSEAIKREKTVLYAARLPYANNAGTTYNLVSYKISDIVTPLTSNNKLSAIVTADKTLSTDTAVYVELKDNSQVSSCTLDELEQYRSSEKMPAKNTFIIVDKNQELYDKVPVDAEHMTDDSRYLIGLLPIVTTATNALYYQKMINSEYYGNVSAISSDAIEYEATSLMQCNGNAVLSNMLVYPTSWKDLDADNKEALTLSKYATGFFPSIFSRADGSLDRDRMKNIGVVVFKGWVDVESGNKIKYEPVEAFAGSLKNDDVDLVTGNSRFIDDIINTNSKTIEFYSNCFNSTIKTEASEDKKIAYFSKINDSCAKYFGETKIDPTQQTQLSVEGNAGYKAKIADIVKFCDPAYADDKELSTQYYICTNINDNIDDADDIETWQKVNEYFDESHGLVVDVNPENNEIDVNEEEYKTIDVNTIVSWTDTSLAEQPEFKYICTAIKEMQVGVKSYEDIALIHASGLKSYALGFTEKQAKDKYVNYSLILQSLDKIFEKNKDINEKQIDLIVDAGVSNIAQFNMIVNKKRKDWCPEYNLLKYEEIDGIPYSAVAEFDLCERTGNGVSSVKKPLATDTWALVLKKYDQFCKTRGDCMFLADGLRPFCVKGQKKRVSKTNFNSTVSKTLTPFIKWMSGKIDTSYGTGNCDWYQIVDPISEVNMWMPPSTKTMCAMLDNFNRKYFWTAPAGVNTGRMNPIDNPSKVVVKDIAFSPTVQEAGDIYTKCWNYATYYQDEGFVLEGQRTFQSRATAFDRVNVRRVFLYLERKVASAAKYFLYEPHTAYTRQRFVDTITPFFEDCKIKGGIADFRIQCDENNNTPDTIDRNELHVKVAIKPTKAIEFIEITFVCLRTGASWSEAGM